MQQDYCGCCQSFGRKRVHGRLGRMRRRQQGQGRAAERRRRHGINHRRAQQESKEDHGSGRHAQGHSINSTSGIGCRARFLLVTLKGARSETASAVSVGERLIPSLVLCMQARECRLDDCSLICQVWLFR